MTAASRPSSPAPASPPWSPPACSATASAPTTRWSPRALQLPGKAGQEGRRHLRQAAWPTTPPASPSWPSRRPTRAASTTPSSRTPTKFLKRLQSRPGDEKDAKFGGVGYDGKEPARPVQHAVLRRRPAGGRRAEGRPGRAAGLKFISRCQNLPGETNDQPFAKKTSDDDKGGLTYTPLDPDDKHAQDARGGGLRSLGAMTYGGLKSFLYAGVSKDDPRVKAAVDWIRRHYTLDENPGMGPGRAVLLLPHLRQGDGRPGRAASPPRGKHDWRKELFEALKKRQRPTAAGSTPIAPSWRTRRSCRAPTRSWR